MIDVKGVWRVWWAWGEDPTARVVDGVFMKEVDPPYRIGAGMKLGKLHVGWVRWWGDDELDSTGSRYLEDVEAEVLGRWGADEDPEGEEDRPQEGATPAGEQPPRLDRDGRQRLPQYLRRQQGRAPSAPRPLRDRRHSVRSN